MPTQGSKRTFRNNYAAATKSLSAVLRWQFQRFGKHLPPPPAAPTPCIRADLAFVQANAIAGPAMAPAVTWLGHATALVQASGLNVLTDPIFSARASPVSFFGPRRHQPPGIALGDLPHIDVVALSHNHYDHLDRASVRALARQPGGPPRFLVPLGLRDWLRAQGIDDAVELNWWGSYGIAGVEFHLTPVQHWSGRGLHDRNRTLWGGWAALGPNFQWYFTGDTGYSADFADTRRHFLAQQTAALGGGFDVALIAIGACEPRWFMQAQHVDPAEAVQVHFDLGAKRSIGVHWGTFELSDESLDYPPRELRRARDARDLPEAAFFVLAVGETRRLPVRVVSVPLLAM
jgi:N-acyl-phosphatidylethanolamine-hydrolysing phospholipase D